MPRMTICRSSFSLLLTLGLSAPALAQGAKATSHTVQKGDTLWDIARAYLGDPFLWPQIYRLNTDIVENPHWIYPGEVLKLEGVPGQTAVPTTDTPVPVTVDQPAPVRPSPGITVLPPSMTQEPASGDGMDLFRRKKVSAQNAFKTYREARFHPLRAGEFYSSGFLTEGDSLSWGALLGPVTPEQIESGRSRAAVQNFTSVGMRPPEGATYAVGDTLVAVDRREGPIGYGEIVVPTGLIRVTGQNGNQVIGDVIAVYGPIRNGQSLLPAEKFTDPGPGQYVSVADGLEGRVLVSRDARELRHPQEVIFIDIGRSAGVAPGDVFHARRTPGPQDKTEADAVDEVMATLQVIHVRGRTATVKVLNVVSPDIKPGTRVKQVAKLPS
jgi:LysM repeat protein